MSATGCDLNRINGEGRIGLISRIITPANHPFIGNCTTKIEPCANLPWIRQGRHGCLTRITITEALNNACFQITTVGTTRTDDNTALGDGAQYRQIVRIIERPFFLDDYRARPFKIIIQTHRFEFRWRGNTAHKGHHVISVQITALAAPTDQTLVTDGAAMATA